MKTSTHIYLIFKWQQEARLESIDELYTTANLINFKFQKLIGGVYKMLAGCHKCTKIIAALFLIVGVMHLGQDYGWWTFWLLNWYTTAFLVIGIAKLGNSKCSDCQAVVAGKKK